MSPSPEAVGAVEPRHVTPYDDVLGTIGWTPLIRLNKVHDGCRTPIYGKAEFMNPGGSVKDRIGTAIIEAAERDGSLRPGGTVVEGTSGNTGVGLALAAVIKGYRCIFTIPDKMSQEKVRLLKAFGAEVIVTPTAVPAEHPDHYVTMAKRIASETPNAILANQFYNQANPEAHYATTGPELWTQTEGRITHLVGSAGTGGTISGAGKFLKERKPEVKVIAGDPEGSILSGYFRTGSKGEGTPYKVEGIGNEKIPDTLWFDVLDDYRTVGDKDSFHMARRLTREEGLFVGGSTGLIVHLGVQLAREVDDPDACIVCVLCDTGERYLSKLYNEEWMRENRMLESERVRLADLLERKDGGAPGALIAVQPAMPVRQALSILTSNDVSQLPVLLDGDCVGSLSEAALMSRVIEQPAVLDRAVEAVMEPPFPVVDEAQEPRDVAPLLTRENPAVLVRRRGEIAGILTRYDMVRHLTR